MNDCVTVRDWAAWAPGLHNRLQWQRWAAEPWLPGPGNDEDVPPLPEVPAMQRRRLSRLGRAAVQVAHAVQGGRRAPMVFASRWGDVRRALGAVEALHAGEPLSPTVFAASVHNGIAAQLSIFDANTQPMTCVAGGALSAAAGVIEAAALLADGAPEVVLVCCDEPLPAPYEPFADEPQAWYAWAWRLGAVGEPGEAALGLAPGPAAAGDDAQPTRLPAGLELLRWMIAGEHRLEQLSAGQAWTWTRRA